jgi:hypothetical protein
MKIWKELQKLWEACCEDYVVVYIERLPADRLPKFRVKLDNHYALKLMGVNVSMGRDGPEIDPVYIPLFGIQKDQHMLGIDFYFWKTDPWSIFFLDEWPFIYTVKRKLFLQDSKEDEDAEV